MDVHPVDPRTATWEVEQPRYRVYFWGKAMASYEYEITHAADVSEVIEWARANAGADRTYTVYAVAEQVSGATGIIRLLGTDPTRG